jgi:hypothetical protein
VPGLINEWGQLLFRAGLLSRASGSGLGWFSRAEGGLICMSSCYIASSYGRFRIARVQIRSDHPCRDCDNVYMKERKRIFSGESVEIEWERTETLVDEYDQSTLQTCMKIK